MGDADAGGTTRSRRTGPGAGPGADPWAEDLALALDAARAAGAAVMGAFGTDPAVRFKGPDQPVTDADLEADAVLRARLTGARPEDGWLSEESVDRSARLERRRVWIVDPIDGTRSFIEGYREFAVSVALAEAGAPVVGVIYNPARSHAVWATAAGGAFSAEDWSGGTAGAHRLDLAAGSGAGAAGAGPGAGSGATLLASRTERQRGELEPFEAEWRVRELGSTAWKLAGAAMGWGAYISRGPKSEWDVAAGALIVDQAGGRVTDLDGHAIPFNRPEPYVRGVVAGRPRDHARLLERARTLDSPRLGRGAWKGNNGGV